MINPRLLAIVATLVLTVASLVHAQQAGDNRATLVPIAPGWAGNSVNVVIFRHASIVSHGDTQFAAFYDQDGKVVLARRTLGNSAWEVKPTQYSGNVKDAHNAISIGVDGKGYLHVAWDHHNVPLRYARSREPLSIELGEKLPMTQQHETRVSYPEFYPMPDGGLIFFYRDGASGSGNLVLNRYDVQTSTWTQLHENLIDGQGQRNAYTQATVDPKGVIHLSWVWRESPDVATNHDLCYARSSDGGKTWTRSNGEAYTIPITAASAEVAVTIPQRSELINQTSMTTDSKGRPYIATYWREQGEEIPQYHIVYRDTDGWKTSIVGGQTVAFRLGGAGTKRIPLSRPQIFADASGATDKAYLLFRDEGRGNKVSIAICNDLSNPAWTLKDLTTSSVGQWEPSYDAALWAGKKQLNALVQKVDQPDAEGVSNIPPEMVYVLQWAPQD